MSDWLQVLREAGVNRRGGAFEVGLHNVWPELIAVAEAARNEYYNNSQRNTYLGRALAALEARVKEGGT